MVGAVLAQTDLHAALDAASTAVETGFAGYGVIPADQAVDVSGAVDTRWGAESSLRAEPRNNKAITVRQGTKVSLTMRVLGASPGATAGTRIAVIDGVVETSGEHVQWAVVLDSDLPGPSFWWRLLHGGG
jgi:hypothetical protein